MSNIISLVNTHQAAVVSTFDETRLPNVTAVIQANLENAKWYGNSNQIPRIQVDPKGRVLVASNINLDSSIVIPATLPNIIAAGTTGGSNVGFPVITNDAQGRITSISTSTINTSLISSGVLSIARGGTGTSNTTGTGAVVYSSNASVIGLTSYNTTLNGSITVSGFSNVYNTYPLFPLTANSTVIDANTSYISSSSSTNSSPSFQAFDYSNSTAWTSARHTYPNVGFGNAQWNTFTLIDGSNIKGEWLQLELSSPINLNAYTVSVGILNIPQKWILAGSSNGGSTWTSLDAQTFSSWGSAAVNTVSFGISSVIVDYNLFRMVVLQASGEAVSVIGLSFVDNYQISTDLSISGLTLRSVGGLTTTQTTVSSSNLITSQLVTDTANVNSNLNVAQYVTASNMAVLSQLQSYPSTAMTGYTTTLSDGIYIASSSSEITSSWTAWNAFDSNVATGWQTAMNTYSNPGSQLRNIPTRLTGGTFLYGEWLQLQVPSPIVLQSYTLTINTFNVPQSWTLVGSQDGNLWTILDVQTLVSWNKTTLRFGLTLPPNNAFTYYRLVVQNASGVNVIVMDMSLQGQILTSFVSGTANTLTGLINLNGNATVLNTLTTQNAKVNNILSASNLTVTSTQTIPPTMTNTWLATANTAFTTSSSGYSNNNDNFNTWRAFDGNTSTFWGSVANSYSNNSPALNSYTLVDSSNVQGEWLQLQFNPLSTLQSYTIRCRNDLVSVPQAWILAGSSNNTIWTQIDRQSNVSTIDYQSTSNFTLTYPVTSTSNITYLRLIVLQSSGSDVGVSELRYNIQPTFSSTANVNTFIVIPSATFSNNLSVQGTLVARRSTIDSGVFNSNVQLNSLVLANNICLTSPAFTIPPANNQTNNTITSSDGNYIASASSQFSSSNQPWKAFSSFEDASGTYWLSGPNSYANGTQVNNVSTTVSGSTVLGEWLQLQVPKPVFVQSYTIAPRVDLSTFVSTPTAWVLAGSTDGTNWVQLDMQSNVSANTFQAAANSGYNVTYPLTTSGSFSYFRIIFQGSTRTDVGILNMSFSAQFSTATRLSSSNCTFTTPTIFSSNVGIGTASPVTPLDITGNTTIRNGNLSLIATGAQAITATSAGTQAELKLINATGCNNGFGVDNNGCYVYGQGGGGSQKLVVSHANGFVGIGTASPITQLDVSGATSLRGAVGIGTAANGYMNVCVLHDNTNSTGILGCRTINLQPTANSGYYTSTWTASTGIGWNLSNQYLDVSGRWGINFWTNDPQTVKAVVLPNGNFGVGTTNPATLLDINGTTTLRGTVGVGVTNIGATGNFHLYGKAFFTGYDGACLGFGGGGNPATSSATPGTPTFGFFKGYNSAPAIACSTGNGNNVIPFGQIQAADFTSSTTAFTEWARFDANGRLGIGMTNPSYQLQLSTDSAAKPSTSTWTISSDQRVKTDIESANQDRCYEIIKSLDLKYYRYNDEYLDSNVAPDRRRLGWIAQEVETIFPKAVTVSSNYGIEDCKSLNVDQIYAAMYGCIKKMQATQEAMQTKINSLETTIVDLTARLPPP